MTRYFIKFSYIGTQYRGMQLNSVRSTDCIVHDLDTVQGALQNAFLRLRPECVQRPKITVSSRTDAGVHAFCNTAHIEIDNKYNSIYNPLSILPQVNNYFHKCHHDIRLLECIPVTKPFHARHFAKCRTYIYRIMIPKNVTDHKIPVMEMSRTLYIRKADTFDIERVKNGVELFMGLKDFRTFSAKSVTNKPIEYVRSLQRFTIEKAQPLMPDDPLSQNFEYWNIVCRAKSFLYNQVRRMVSSLFALGEGLITEKDIKVMLQVPGHHNWHPKIKVVPSYGLYLVNIQYHQSDLDEHSIRIQPASADSLTVAPIVENEVK